MQSTLKITSQNVRGLGNTIKLKRIISSLAQTNSDIILLQETHINPNNFHELKSKWIKGQYHALGSSASRGMAILISKELPFQLKGIKKDSRDRYLFVKGLIADQMTNIVSMYAPNENQIEFEENALENLSKFQEGTTIIGDDLNYIIDNKLDRSYVSTRDKKGNQTKLNWPRS